MKNKLPKKGLAIFLSVGVLASGVVAYVLNRHHVIHEENSIGYENINPICNFNVHQEDFVLLNVGDHNTVGTWFQDRKMELCNQGDISLGVVINTDAKNEEDIYNDVEYTKGLIKKFDIDFPVYLNIDKIITNDNLNIEMKKKIIMDFLVKCSSNDIYVGVSGTDTNLCRMKKYCEIVGYDAYLIMDKADISYDGGYNVYKDLDGNIKSLSDLSKMVRDRNLNSEEGFVGDYAYTVQAGENILDISLKYGISVNELLRFNNLTEDDITEKTIIRIPSVIDSESTRDHVVTNKTVRGCDISYAQGDSSDWEALSDNFDFIILRSNHGVEEDNCFEVNAFNCNKYNIPMGVYCYNDYFLQDCGDDIESFNSKQKQQAETTLNLLKNKKVDYPVYLDIEHANGLSKETLSKKQVQEMLKNWAEKISEAGYIPGIYCNQSGYDYLSSCVSYNISDTFEVWIAGGEQYFADKQNIDIDDVKPSSILDDSDIDMAQSTDSCVNAGAGNASGHLDIDFSKKDYTTTTTIKKNNKFKIKDFTRVNYGAVGVSALGGSGIVGGGILLGYGIKKKKRKTHKHSR